jgi:hypothetical protein
MVNSAAVLGTTIVLMVWFTPVLINDINAFCIFNCAAEDLKIRLQANVVGQK